MIYLNIIWHWLLALIGFSQPQTAPQAEKLVLGAMPQYTRFTHLQPPQKPNRKLLKRRAANKAARIARRINRR